MGVKVAVLPLAVAMSVNVHQVGGEEAIGVTEEGADGTVEEQAMVLAQN